MNEKEVNRLSDLMTVFTVEELKEIDKLLFKNKVEYHEEQLRLHVVGCSLPSEEEAALELECQLNNLRQEHNEPFNNEKYIEGYKSGFINRDLIWR